jgi:hypothetical protein
VGDKARRKASTLGEEEGEEDTTRQMGLGMDKWAVVGDDGFEFINFFYNFTKIYDLNKFCKTIPLPPYESSNQTVVSHSGYCGGISLHIFKKNYDSFI